ncbi:uncharacterized protein LOC108625051 [Ceratina calcarata]|uniref:Uncharacterized protein LOC108625051 n=1 Tax=Ceratina calcarata TaxID=156304 RepID=A0AAJ7IZ64_9HYME|nr:uncharacterized protein LOC108625051 [Ceratina calcarata]
METHVDDVTLLAKEIKKRNKLSTYEAQYLKGLQICLRRPVLPQHEIESRAGSHIPTHEEMERFQQIAFIKKGSFEPSEDIRIAKNWKKFCKIHNWDQKRVEPFLHFREGSKTHIRSKQARKKFVQFLAHGLPNRTLYSVYHRFRNLYEDRLQRRFHPDEDRMILDHLEHNPHLDEKRKYADLAKVLKRTRASIWRRYKILRRRHERKSSL